MAAEQATDQKKAGTLPGTATKPSRTDASAILAAVELPHERVEVRVGSAVVVARPVYDADVRDLLEAMGPEPTLPENADGPRRAMHQEAQKDRVRVFRNAQVFLACDLPGEDGSAFRDPMGRTKGAAWLTAYVAFWCRKLSQSEVDLLEQAVLGAGLTRADEAKRIGTGKKATPGGASDG